MVSILAPARRSLLPARRSRRGAMILVVALSLAVIFGFAALVLDIGYQRIVRTQLQIGIEAAAHAGTKELDGTEAGMERARATTSTVAELFVADGDAIRLSEDQITLGVYSSGAFATSDDASTVNAVQVETNRNDIRPILAKVAFDHDDMAVDVTTAVTRPYGGAAAVSCFIPIALADCMINDLYGDDGIAMVSLTLNPAGIDNVGWARPDANPSASWLKSQVADCEYEGGVAVGDSIRLNNGVITSVLSEIINEIEDSTTAWDADTWGTLPSQVTSSSGINSSKYGHTFEGPVMLFHNDSYCTGSGGSWNTTETISGFVWGAIYDVYSKGSPKTILVRLDATHEYNEGTEVGGPDYGVTAYGPTSFVR